MKNFSNGGNASHNCIQVRKSNDLFELAGLNTENVVSGAGENCSKSGNCGKDKNSGNDSWENPDRKVVSHDLFELCDVDNFCNNRYKSTNLLSEITSVKAECDLIDDNEDEIEESFKRTNAMFGNYNDYNDFDSEDFMFETLLESHSNDTHFHKNINNQYECEYVNGKRQSKKPIQGTDEHQIELCKMLTEHIVAILDENGNKIEYNEIQIKYEKRTWSKTFSKVLYIDGKPLESKYKTKYKIIYKCRCGRENAIVVKKYFIKEEIRCPHCLQDKNYEKDYIPVNSKEWQIKHKDDVKKIPITDFNLMDEDFKNDYSKTHMSEEQLFYYLPKIFRINNHIISECDISEIKYKYAVPTNNQMYFTSKISFDNGITYETIKEIYLKCDVCDRIFRIHIDNIFKQDVNEIRCSYCKCTNRRYTINKYSEDSNLTYQSMLEKDFIDIVKSMDLQIENGHIVNYMFENKIKHYVVDFYLPSEKLLVEIKAKNQFYKQDIKTGKLQAKVIAAKEYAKQNGLIYIMLFENDVYNFKDILHKLKNK